MNLEYIIHDGRRPMGDAMNGYRVFHLVHYELLEKVYSLGKPHYFLAKGDLKSTYQSLPLYTIDYCLAGLKLNHLLGWFIPD